MTTSHGLDVETGRAALRHVRSNIAAFVSALRRVPHRAGRTGLWTRPGRVVIGALLTIVVLAIITVTTDAWAIIQARALPRWFISTFDVITDFGLSGWFLWPLGVALLILPLISSPRVGWISERVIAAVAVRFTFLFLAIAVPGLFVAIVKRLIGRGRPFVGGMADPYRYDPFVWSAPYASLPSGHATTAFAAAVAIGAVWPQTRAVMWIYAFLVAISRVVVSAHHPSDVVAGAVVGVIGAVLVRNWFTVRRLGFAMAADGRSYAMPGPSWRRVIRVAARLRGP